MRRLLTVGLAGVLALAGCGGDGKGGGNAAPSPTATAKPAAVVATEAQLKAALLSGADMPGWSVEKPEGDDDDAFGDTCKPLAALDTNKIDVSEIEAEFAKKGQPPFVNQAVASLESPAAVSAEMQGYKKAFAACPSFTDTDEDGAKIKVTIKPLPFAKLGDESMAFRLIGTMEGAKITYDFLVVRVRNHATILAASSIDSEFGSGVVSTTEFTAIARKAVQKMATALP